MKERKGGKMRRRKQSLRRWIKQCIRWLHTKRIGKVVKKDLKTEFEKEILDILVKYKLHNNLQSSLQHLVLTLDVDNLPVIKMRTLLIDKKEGKDVCN